MSAPLSMAGVSEKDLKEEHDAFDKNVLKSFTKKKAINTRFVIDIPAFIFQRIFLETMLWGSVDLLVQN